MPKPCTECPFNVEFKGRYPSENLIMYVGAALAEDSTHVKECHTADYKADCEGLRRFMAGETEGVFTSVIEMAKVRASDMLATEFFTQIDRLYGRGESDAA